MLPFVTLQHSDAYRSRPGRLLLLAALVNSLTVSSCLGQANQSTITAHAESAPAICDISESGSTAVDRSGSLDIAPVSGISLADHELETLEPGLHSQESDGTPQCKKPEGAPKSVAPRGSTLGLDSVVAPKVTVTPSTGAAPVVSYANGELTVVAHNRPLSEILDAIHNLTGMSIELPPSGPDEQRFYQTIGPAPLGEALARLLDGTPFNYVLSSSKDPSLSKLILTARASSPHPGRSGVIPPSTEEAAGPSLYGGPGFSVDEGVSPAVANAVANAPPNGIPANFDVKQAAAASQKTPGQILDELQKQQLQQLDQQSSQQPPPQQ
jgi:hypothetical protein